MPDLDNEQAGFDDEVDDAVLDDAIETAAPTETPEPPAPIAIEYADLTKAEYDALQAKIVDLTAAQDRSFGTFGRTIKGIQDAVEAMKSGAQVEIDQADIDALREDGFVPLAKVLEKVRSMRSLPAQTIDPAKIDELVQQRVAPALETINTTVERAVETRLLARDHPDWREITSQPGFAAYAAGLPAAERTALDASWDSTLIGRHLSAFKAKSAPVTPSESTTQRRNRFAAAATPSGNGRSNTNATGSDERSGFDSVK
ncbi:MAG: hypothetical protein RL030_1782 [Pseudomonadota bacterium]|jgi:hypothetical protein